MEGRQERGAVSILGARLFVEVGRLCGTGRQSSGSGHEIRCSCIFGQLLDVERRRAFAGRLLQRSALALWLSAIDAPARPSPPLRLWARALFLELRGGASAVRSRRGRFGV